MICSLYRLALSLIMVASPLMADEITQAPDWSNVSTIFVERCVMCHAEHGAGLGLRLDNYDAAVAGSTNGPVLLPGDPELSELIRRLRGQSKPRMPFLSTPLSDDQIDLVVRWIDAGLPHEAPIDDISERDTRQ